MTIAMAAAAAPQRVEAQWLAKGSKLGFAPSYRERTHSEFRIVEFHPDQFHSEFRIVEFQVRKMHVKYAFLVNLFLFITLLKLGFFFLFFFLGSIL